ncbi:hypothetical protein [Leptospira koniambonensis]|uniref:hypothetical protein n=1 Tax=Leptospira koniambonensis TaxID=2484950 RepID=UPI003EBD8246
MPKLLAENEFLKTFSNPHELRDREVPIRTDFWSYYDEIPESHFGNHIFSDTEVSYIYRNDNNFDHILISSENKNIVLVLINDRKKDEIVGHFILDLEKQYGLK